MKLTVHQVMAACAANEDAATRWLPHIQRACDSFEISNRLRIAAFLASIGTESGGLTRIEESLDYSAHGLLQAFPGVFSPQGVVEYESKPQHIANRVYGGRLGNGPEASGDGWRYRGRGLIPLRGRADYRRAGTALGLPLEDEPELAARPEHAAMVAGWLWRDRRVNPLADRNNIGLVTRALIERPRHLAERHTLYRAALRALDGQPPHG